MSTDDPHLTSEEAAAYCGIALGTWDGYQSRRHPRGNPVPLKHGYDHETGRAYWLQSELDAWKARRPGPGARTDLADKKPAE